MWPYTRKPSKRHKKKHWTGIKIAVFVFCGFSAVRPVSCFHSCHRRLSSLLLSLLSISVQQGYKSWIVNTNDICVFVLLVEKEEEKKYRNKTKQGESKVNMWRVGDASALKVDSTTQTKYNNFFVVGRITTMCVFVYVYVWIGRNSGTHLMG